MFGKYVTAIRFENMVKEIVKEYCIIGLEV
jgi:hypothetical protein